MSQFRNGVSDLLPSGGAPNIGVRRKGAAEIATPLVSEALTAPGLTPLPPTDRSVLIADQILQAVGHGGRLADQVRVTAYYDQQREKAAQAETEAAARKQQRADDEAREAFEKAQGAAGVAAARVDLPQLAADIDNDKLRAEEGEKVEDAAKRILTTELGGEVVSEAYRDAYHKALMPGVVELLVKQQQGKQAEARRVAGGKILAGVAGAHDPEALTRAAADLRKIDPSLAPEDALVEVGKATLAYAEAANDRRALDAAKAKVGAVMKTQVARVEGAISAKEAQDRAKINAESRQSLFRMINDKEPVERVMGVAHRMRKLGTLEEDDYATLRGRLLEQEAKVTATEQEQQFRQTSAATDVAAMQNQAAWMIPEREQLKLADGRMVTLTRAERMEDAARGILANAAQMNPQDPVAGLNVAIKTLSDNDYLPDNWRRMLEAGAAQATTWNIEGDARPGSKEPDRNLPIAVSQSLDLYQRLKAAESPLIYKLPDATRRTFDSIIEVQRNSGEGSLANQAAAVAQARVLRESKAEPVPELVIRKHAKDLYEKVTNKQEVVSLLSERATFYRRLGIDADTAAKKAAADYEGQLTVINGWAVDLSKASLPTEVRKVLPSISQGMAAEWIARHPDVAKARDLTSKDMVLAFNDANGLWSLLDARTGRMVPHQNPAKLNDVITTFHVLRIIDRLDQQKRDELEKSRIMQEQRRKQELGKITDEMPPDGFF